MTPDVGEDPALHRDPAARYKEILDVAREAAVKVAEHERRRAVELISEIGAADKAISAAGESEKQINTEITAWWRKVSAMMAGLSWISAGPIPKADPTANPDLLDTYLAEIEPATQGLKAALKKASWRRPG